MAKCKFDDIQYCSLQVLNKLRVILILNPSFADDTRRLFRTRIMKAFETLLHRTSDGGATGQQFLLVLFAFVLAFTQEAVL